MNREQMITYLNRKDTPGAGVVVTLADDTERYFYYADTETERGFNRASKDFFKPICERKIKSAEYFHNDGSAEFFIDWQNAPGRWSVSDHCIAWNNKTGRETCYEYGTIAAMIDGKSRRYDYKAARKGIIEVYFKDSEWRDYPEWERYINAND